MPKPVSHSGNNEHFDYCIIGAGPVGLTLALLLQNHGLKGLLIDAHTEQQRPPDKRALALSAGSQHLLARVNVWQTLQTTPIDRVHVSQWRGFGQTLIEASELQQTTLGHVVGAEALREKLHQQLQHHILILSGCKVIDDAAITENQNELWRELSYLQNGLQAKLRCRLAIYAEGGIHQEHNAAKVSRYDFEQYAIVSQLVVRRPDNTAYERFTENGPLACLPYDNGYSIVHCVSKHQHNATLALSDADYLAQLRLIMAGRLQIATPSAPIIRQAFPLIMKNRHEIAKESRVWLGNAAQTLHPVAGQGFNLALRDCLTLTEILRQYHQQPLPGLLQSYANKRWLDRRLMLSMTRAFVEGFSMTHPIAGTLRGAALQTLGSCPPLRKMLAKRLMFGAYAWP